MTRLKKRNRKFRKRGPVPGACKVEGCRRDAVVKGMCPTHFAMSKSLTTR